jgi:hypothetical protein
MDRVNAHQGLAASHLAAGLVDDGIKQRIFTFRNLLQPRLELGAGRGRKLEQPRETLVGIGHR